jgi:hypothetical protein
MRHLAKFLGAALVCTMGSFAIAQTPPLSLLEVGNLVDYNQAGQWIPCTVSTPLNDNGYTVHCGSLDFSAKADPSQIRLHIAGSSLVRQAIESKDIVSLIPEGESIGAKFGTRNPRTCDARKGTINSTEARDIFICDAEHEFGGNLYLVSDVSLLVSTPRPFSPNEDSTKVGIDATQPVLDIRASYNNFQCSKLPSSYLDYPGNRNCNEFKMANAAGSCFKNNAGEWHCLMYDFHRSAQADARNVKPPTLTD